MNCQFFMLHYENLLDGLLGEAERTAMESHVAKCSDCRARIENRRRLIDALRQSPIPPARDGFAEAALRHARAVHEHKPVYIGKPARRRIPLWFVSGVTGVAAGVLVLMGTLWFARPAPSGVATVVFRVKETRSVRFAFTSPEELRNVTLSLELPANFEFANRPRDRSLRWRATLRKGGNVITVPIMALRGGNGDLVAKVARNHKVKSFRVLLKAGAESIRSERANSFIAI